MRWQRSGEGSQRKPTRNTLRHGTSWFVGVFFDLVCDAMPSLRHQQEGGADGFIVNAGCDT